MASDALKLLSDPEMKNDGTLKCYIKFGSKIEDLEGVPTMQQKIGGFSKMNSVLTSSNDSLFVVVELRRYGEESWALPLDPVDVSEIEKLRLQARKKSPCYNNLNYNNLNKYLALAVR